jgi:hypothetical protein
MMEHMARITHKQMNQGNHWVHTSFVPPAYLPCITSVTKLQRIMIRDLRLETHHRGKYLLLGAITPPDRMTAIMAIVEDEQGKTSILSLYQQEDEDIRKAASIVNKDMVLLLKEPYYKILGDGEYGLRVDHLSDMIHIDNDDVRVPNAWQPRIIGLDQSAASLKDEGNAAMGEGRFWDAITE